MSVVEVQLTHGSYEVRIGEGLLEGLGASIARLCRAARIHLVIDRSLPDATVLRASNSLEAAGFKISRSKLSASEPEKSISSTERLLQDMGSARLDRNDCVVALGGGIVGDIAGFAAAIYRRGVDVIQCPTTLLAMVDASVGGKTGVNLSIGGALRKNMVGCFWQPRLVLADIGVLASLEPRQFRSGLAECLKHAMLCGESDPDLWSWTVGHVDRITALHADVLAELVERNVRIKAAIVAGDEREMAGSQAGGRALLNLGHTFGHAIETLPHLSPDGNAANAPLLHGEAVGYGLIAATASAAAMGKMPDAQVKHVRDTVCRTLRLAPRLAGLPGGDDLLEAMGHDKKVRAGVLRLVLPVDGARCLVVEDPPTEIIRAGLAAIGG